MRSLSLASILALTFLFPACGSSEASAREEGVSLMEQIGNTLETAKDEASAKAAAAKLDPIITRMNALAKEHPDMGKPTGKEGEAVDPKFEARAQAAMTKMMTEMGRVMADPKLSPIIQPVMAKMQNK